MSSCYSKNYGRQIHIGFVSRNAFPLDCKGHRGGVGRYLDTILPAITKTGAKVTVFSEAIDQRYSEESIHGASVYFLPRWQGENNVWRRIESGILRKHPGKKIWADVSSKFRRASILSDFIRSIRERNPKFLPDTVELPDVGAEGFFLALGRQAGVKCAVRIHGPTQCLMETGGFAPTPGRRLLVWAERRVAHRCLAASAPSEYAAKMAVGRWRLRNSLPEIIPNPVNTALFQPGDYAPPLNRPFIILYSGRVQKGKGLSCIPSLVNTLYQYNFFFEIRFAGKDTSTAPDGTSYREWLVRQSPESARHCLRFLGQLDDLALLSELRSADMGLYPSVETFGYAGLEAMACGMPIVALRQGAFSKFIEDGWNGFLVNSANDDKIKEIVKKSIQNPVELLGVRQNAIKTIRNKFSPFEVGKALIKFHKKLAI